MPTLLFSSSCHAGLSPFQYLLSLLWYNSEGNRRIYILDWIFSPPSYYSCYKITLVVEPSAYRSCMDVSETIHCQHLYHDHLPSKKKEEEEKKKETRRMRRRRKGGEEGRGNYKMTMRKWEPTLGKIDTFCFPFYSLDISIGTFFQSISGNLFLVQKPFRHVSNQSIEEKRPFPSNQFENLKWGFFAFSQGFASILEGGGSISKIVILIAINITIIIIVKAIIK